MSRQCRAPSTVKRRSCLLCSSLLSFGCVTGSDHVEPRLNRHRTPVRRIAARPYRSSRFVRFAPNRTLGADGGTTLTGVLFTADLTRYSYSYNSLFGSIAIGVWLWHAGSTGGVKSAAD